MVLCAVPGDVEAVDDGHGALVPLERTPGGALWAAVTKGALYYRWDEGAPVTPEDADRWLALTGGVSWDARHRSP